MWLGPPYMKRKMTLFAFAVRWLFFGASGLAKGVPPSAATAWLVKKPSAESKPVSAAAVKPAPASQRNSRRVRRQNDFMRQLLAIVGQMPIPVQVFHVASAGLVPAGRRLAG